MTLQTIAASGQPRFVSSLVPTQRGLQLLLLAITMFAAVFARVAISPLQETMSHALALTDNQIAFLQGPAPTLPVVIGAIPLGMLVDRYCRVRMLLIYAALTIIASFATIYATSFVMLVISRSIMGLVLNATWIAIMSIMADLYAAEQRGRAVMGIAFGESGGSAAAFAVGGALLVVFAGSPEGWRSAMLWMTIPLVPLMLLIFALREPPRSEVTVKNRTFRGDLFKLWDLRAVVAVLVIGRIMLCIADGAATIWAAPMFSRTYKLPPDQIGAMMGTILLFTGILGAVGSGLLSDLCQRFSGPRMTIMGLGIITFLSVPVALFPLAPDSMLSATMLFIFIMCGSVVGIATATVATVVIPNELRGLCIAVMQSVMCLLGAAPAPLTVSLLTGALGGPQMLSESLAIVCVVSSVAGALLFFWGQRYFPSQKQVDVSE